MIHAISFGRTYANITPAVLGEGHDRRPIVTCHIYSLILAFFRFDYLVNFDACKRSIVYSDILI
jgi:hypothetical protein